MAADQLGFSGMPRRLYAATPSRLTTWQDCPRRYRMTYLDRPVPPKGPPWAHNSLGASAHNALAGWWRLPTQKRTPAGAAGLLEAGWLTDGFRDAEQSARHRSIVRDMVADYVAGLDPHDEPVGVERTVATRTNTVALSGRVDRIDSRMSESREGDGGQEELVVVDYKTGRRPLSADHARGLLALAVYALAAERSLRRPCRRVELHHLPTGAVHGARHTGESLGRHLRRIEAIAAEAAAADTAMRDGLPPKRYDEVFPPRVGPQCGWCDFARHCPEGAAAAPTHQPWDGLPDES